MVRPTQTISSRLTSTSFWETTTRPSTPIFLIIPSVTSGETSSRPGPCLVPIICTIRVVWHPFLPLFLQGTRYVVRFWSRILKDPTMNESRRIPTCNPESRRTFSWKTSLWGILSSTRKICLIPPRTPTVDYTFIGTHRRYDTVNCHGTRVYRPDSYMICSGVTVTPQPLPKGRSLHSSSFVSWTTAMNTLLPVAWIFCLRTGVYRVTVGGHVKGTRRPDGSLLVDWLLVHTLTGVPSIPHPYFPSIRSMEHVYFEHL